MSVAIHKRVSQINNNKSNKKKNTNKLKATYAQY